MTSTYTADRVRRIFANYSGRDADAISAADTLHELGLGDLEAIEISLDIEEMVDAEGTDESWEACKTVGDLARLVDQHVSAVAA